MAFRSSLRRILPPVHHSPHPLKLRIRMNAPSQGSSQPLQATLQWSTPSSSRLRLPRTTLRSLGLGAGKGVIVEVEEQQEDGAGSSSTSSQARGRWMAAAAAWPSDTNAATTSSTSSRYNAGPSAAANATSQGSIPLCLCRQAAPTSPSASVKLAPLTSGAVKEARGITLRITELGKRGAGSSDGSAAKLDQATRDLLSITAKERLIDLAFLLPGQTIRLSLQSTTVLLQASIAGRHEPPRTLEEAQRSVVSIGRPTRIKVINTPQQSRTTAPPIVSSPTKRLGGLTRELTQLHELVTLPLQRPDLFLTHGLRPPRGVLLHGPPGTGKTSLALYIASSFLHASNIFTISGPELSSSYHGRTEARIRAVFRRARRCERSVVIIDEIDVIAGSREGGEGDAVGSRVVATLLTEIDGVGQEYKGKKRRGNDDERVKSKGPASDDDSEGENSESDEESDNDDLPTGSPRPPRPQPRMVVIAATNRPNTLDPALRRPGRLDREIEIGVPDATARLDILETLLAQTPHDLTRDDLAAVAGQTHGFVGADLTALVREAGMRVIRRQLEGERGQGGEELERMAEEKLRVTDGVNGANGVTTSSAPSHHLHLTDLLTTIPHLRPSSLRSTLTPTPLSWSQIGLGSPTSPYSLIRQSIQQSIEWPLRHSARMRRLGITAPRGVLLYGPPGCSKTMIARACAQALGDGQGGGINWIGVKGPELYSKYLGETERSLREVFRKARAAAPTVLFFDEIDALVPTGSGGGEGGDAVAERILATLLTELDSFDSTSSGSGTAGSGPGVIVVAATNKPQALAPSLLRPGRLEVHLFVGLPDVSARRDILRIATAKMAIAGAGAGAGEEAVDLDRLAEMTEGCSGAEVVSMCRAAGLVAMREAMARGNGGDDGEDEGAEDVLCQRHFEEAARNVRRGTDREALRRLEAWGRSSAAGA